VYGLPDPPEPKYWKALLMAALFCIPLSLFVRAVIVHMSDLAWFIMLGVMTLIASYTIHQRVTNDWRARDTMNLERTDRATSVERNIRIGRR